MRAVWVAGPSYDPDSAYKIGQLTPKVTLARTIRERHAMGCVMSAWEVCRWMTTMLMSRLTGTRPVLMMLLIAGCPANITPTFVRVASSG